MIPPYSCSTPGKNPGTSTKFKSGILKASQVLINLAALSEAFISKQPAKILG